MGLTEHFRLLPRYNRIANERIFDASGRLDDAEYRKRRDGSFGGIHGLLNHIHTSNRGKDYLETAYVACSHLFNHQTHHRGQVHVMLSQSGVAPCLE